MCSDFPYCQYNTLFPASQSHYSVFTVHKGQNTRLFPLPYNLYPKAITSRIYPFSRPALGSFKAFRRLASLCASVLTGGGAIFTHAVGILARILPSLFSATIWHSSGLASASLRILVLYLPCENVTVACCWFSKNSITFSAHLSMLKISIFSLFARISSPAPISCNIILFVRTSAHSFPRISC